MVEEKSIEDWLKYFDVKFYDISDDGVVNVNSIGVEMCTSNLINLPINFDIVGGNFDVRDNRLVSLNGSPIKVKGNFNCGYNQLTSLKHSSKEVGRSFYCHNNFLTSLDGGPIELGGGFVCRNNPIYEEYSKYDNYKHYMRSIKLKQLICI
jgi:hypothetical protein